MFLRTEEKKREALRLKDLKDTPPDTPATPITPVEAVAVPALPSSSALAIAPKAEDEAPQPASLESSTGGGQDWLVSATNPVSAEIPSESQQDIPQPSIEVRSVCFLFPSMLTVVRKLRPARNRQ